MSLSYELSNRAGVCLLDINREVSSLLGELLDVKNNDQASYFPPRCRPTWVQVLHSSVWPSRKAKWDLRVSYETTNCILD